MWPRLPRRSWAGLHGTIFGYQVIFFSGAILALISLLVSQWVDPEGQLQRERDAVSGPRSRATRVVIRYPLSA